MFIATINKTLKSYLFAIIGAEYVLNWLPIGTHDWQKFVEPKNLIDKGEKNSLNFIDIKGVKYNPFLDKWDVSRDTSVNYMAKFIKN